MTSVLAELATEDGARAAFARVRPAVDRAVALVARESGALPAPRIVATLEDDLARVTRSTFKGTCSFEAWLAVLAARLVRPASASCVPAEDLAGGAERGRLPDHVGACAACGLAVGAVRAAGLGAVARKPSDRVARPSTKKLATPSSKRVKLADAAPPEVARSRLTPVALALAGVLLGVVSTWIALRSAEPTPPVVSMDEPRAAPVASPAPRVAVAPSPPPPTASVSGGAPANPPPSAIVEDRPLGEEPPPTAPPAVVARPAPAPAPSAPPEATTTPPPPAAPATSTDRTKPRTKLARVTGEITVRSKDGTRRVAPGALDVTPDDSIEGRGHVEIDGKSTVSLDGGKIRARETGERTVVSVDGGDAVVSTPTNERSRVVVETPDGSTIRPEGRVHVHVDPSETALVVVEGHALVTTRSRETDVTAGERASLVRGNVSKRRLGGADLERVRALARRPLVTFCAGEPGEWKLERGTIVEEPGCKTRRAFASAPNAEGKDHKIKIVVDAKGAATLPHVPARGTLRFRYRGSPRKPLLVRIALDGPSVRTRTHLYARDEEWTAHALPLSIPARTFAGIAGASSVVCLEFMHESAFAIDDVTLGADPEGERTDGAHERVFVSIRCDHPGREPNEVLSILEDGTVIPFELVAGKVVPSRALGPEGNGALVPGANNAIELVPKVPIKVQRSEAMGGHLALRWCSTGKASAEPRLDFTNEKIEVTGEHVRSDLGAWSFYDLRPWKTPPLVAFLERIRIVVSADRAQDRDGFQLDDLELASTSR